MKIKQQKKAKLIVFIVLFSIAALLSLFQLKSVNTKPVNQINSNLGIIKGETITKVDLYAFGRSSNDNQPPKIRVYLNNEETLVGEEDIEIHNKGYPSNPSERSHYDKYTFNLPRAIKKGDQLRFRFYNDTSDDTDYNTSGFQNRDIALHSIVLGGTTLHFRQKDNRIFYNRANREDSTNYDIGDLGTYTDDQSGKGVIRYNDLIWPNGPRMTGQIYWNGDIVVNITWDLESEQIPTPPSTPVILPSPKLPDTNSTKIEIRAYGTQAFGFNPDMQLWINNGSKKVDEWVDISATSEQTAQIFLHNFEGNFNEVESIEVVFPNDAWQSSSSDRDLYIDYIKVDNKTYQAEDQTDVTYDRFSPFDNREIQPSNKWLVVNNFNRMAWEGSLKFKIDNQLPDITPTPKPTATITPKPTPTPALNDTEIIVRAKGSQAFGEMPNMILYIDNKYVKRWESNEITKNYENYKYNHNVDLNGSEIAISFDNDAYDTSNGQDRNLYIESITIKNKRYATKGSQIIIYDRAINGGYFNDYLDLVKPVTEELLWNGALRINADGTKVQEAPISKVGCQYADIMGININPVFMASKPSLNELSDLKVCWLRFELQNVRNYHDSLPLYSRAGFKNLAIVNYGTTGLEKPQPTASDNEWNKYIDDLTKNITRFATTYGDHINAWELWNEPDLNKGIDGGPINPYLPPKRYAQFLDRVHPILKEITPNAKQVAGAYTSGDVNYAIQVRNFLQGKSYSKFDALSIHPYGQRADNYPPGFGFGEFKSLAETYYNQSNGLPIWITEFGYNTYSENTSQEQIAAEYIKRFYRVANDISYVDKTFIFAWNDDMVPFFGLRGDDLNNNGNGRKKPQWYSYKDVAVEINNISPPKTVPTNPPVSNNKTKIEVNAWGSSAFGINPDLEIWVQRLGKWTKQNTWNNISSTTRENANNFTYLYDEKLTKSDKIAVTFLNDAYEDQQNDRNLYINYIKVNGIILQAEDLESSYYDRGINGGTAFDSQDILTAREEMSWNGAMIFSLNKTNLEDGINLPSNDISCPSIPGSVFGALQPDSLPTERPAKQHADLNLELRGYTEVTDQPKELLYIKGGATDILSPNLNTLRLQSSTTTVQKTFQIHDWNWAPLPNTGTKGASITDPWPVTLIQINAVTGEPLTIPQSGYSIGGGYNVLVLYADKTRITLKYTREDNIVRGYAIHIEDVCVEPTLLDLYEQLNKEGRKKLPALKHGSTFATALNNQVKVSIRDTGQFMDPRSIKDWWK